MYSAISISLESSPSANSITSHPLPQFISYSNVPVPVICFMLLLVRLDALNVAWTDMSRGAVVYLVICLPQSLTKLNLSGCRETLLDEGKDWQKHKC